MRKNLFIFFIIFSFLVIFSCENNEQDVIRITRTKTVSPTLTGRDVHVDYRDSGLVVLKMDAKTLKRYQLNVPDPYYEADDGLRVRFYNKLGKQVSILTAQYGVYYERDQRVEVRYKVVVENEEGQKVETEKLLWRQNDSIRSEGQVIMWEKGKKIVGNKLVSTEDFSHMELYDITAILPFEEPKK